MSYVAKSESKCINEVFVRGVFETDFEINHRCYGHVFYRTRIRTPRLSGVEDVIPVIIPDTIDSSLADESAAGKYVEIRGMYRSRNERSEGRSHLILYLYAKSMYVYENEQNFDQATNNIISLEGYICKPVLFRSTLRGKKITDMLLAVNRTNDYDGPTDYIPCIAWESQAETASYFEVGNKIKIKGRIQSRIYFKRYSFDTDEGEYREAYEVSINEIEFLSV